MLEQLRRNSRSWLIWFIFAILIAAFVLFFGPQSGPEMFGCAGSASTVVEVDDHEVQVHSWRFAMNGLGGSSSGQAAARRAQAIDALVERQILAAEAERMGMKVSDDLVRERIKVGEITLLGYRLDGRNIFFRNGVFDYKALELWVKNSGLSSVDSFISEQKREILAEFARDMLSSSVHTSMEEARMAFIEGNTKVSLDYVLFPLSRYTDALTLTEQDAERYAATNETALNEAWETEKIQFSTAKPRVLARLILVEKSEASNDKPDDMTTVPPTEPGEGDEKEGEKEAATDTGKQRAESILARLNAGEDFAKVALEVSDDTRSKGRGGLLGWRSADALGYGTAVVEAVKALEPGATSAVIEGPRGFHIVKLIERAEEALTFEQRKADIAFRLAAKFYAEKLAARDAAAALKTAEGTTLAEAFERDAPSPTPFQPGQQGLTPEQQLQLQKFQEDMKRQLNEKEGAKSGWIFREGDIQLAQAGAASETAKEAAPDPAPAAADVVLPTVEVAAGKVRKLGPLSRPPQKLPGVGRSKELIRDLFEKLDEGQVGPKVYSVSEPDGLVIVQLLDREEADLEKFMKEADQTREQMAFNDAVENVYGFVARRCRELADGGKLGINKIYLKYDDDKPPAPYSACASLSEQSIAQQLRMRLESR